MKPLPEEGGFYVETHRAAGRAGAGALPSRYGGGRSWATAILYLLTEGTCSRLHRLVSDEVWHFYLGDPVEMLQLRPDGGGELLTLGPDILQGQQVQTLVEAGVWQGARLRPGGRFALLGCTVSPGFEPEDFEPARGEAILPKYPEYMAWIQPLI